MAVRSPNVSGLLRSLAQLQQSNALKAQREEAERRRREQRQQSALRTIGAIGGGVLGGIAGGPAGASAGISLGSTAGGLFGAATGRGQISPGEIVGAAGSLANFQAGQEARQERADQLKIFESKQAELSASRQATFGAAANLGQGISATLEGLRSPAPQPVGRGDPFPTDQPFVSGVIPRQESLQSRIQAAAKDPTGKLSAGIIPLLRTERANTDILSAAVNAAAPGDSQAILDANPQSTLSSFTPAQFQAKLDKDSPKAIVDETASVEDIGGLDAVFITGKDGKKFNRVLPKNPDDKISAFSKLLDESDLTKEQKDDARRKLIAKKVSSTGRRITVGPEGTVIEEGIDLGGREVSKPLVNKLQTQIAGNIDILDGLNAVSINFNEESLTALGKGKVLFNNLIEFLGADLSDDQKQTVIKDEAFKTRVTQFFANYRRAVTGAQASDKELERLEKQVINLKLSPTQFKARLQVLKEEAARSIRLNNRILRVTGEGKFKRDKDGNILLDKKGNEVRNPKFDRLLANFTKRGVDDDTDLYGNFLVKNGIDPDEVDRILIREGYQ